MNTYKVAYMEERRFSNGLWQPAGAIVEVEIQAPTFYAALEQHHWFAGRGIRNAKPRTQSKGVRSYPAYATLEESKYRAYFLVRRKP